MDLEFRVELFCFADELIRPLGWYLEALESEHLEQGVIELMSPQAKEDPQGPGTEKLHQQMLAAIAECRSLSEMQVFVLLQRPGSGQSKVVRGMFTLRKEIYFDLRKMSSRLSITDLLLDPQLDPKVPLGFLDQIHQFANQLWQEG